MATLTHYVDRDARVTASPNPSDLGSGACAHLDVGTYSGYAYESWLAFIGESWAGIPNAAAITSAVLKVYAGTQYHIARTTGTMRVRRTSSLGTVFNEGTASHPMSGSNAVTGGNAPATTATNEATASIADADGWKSVTITNIIKDYFGQANYALQLHANSGVYEFDSREAGANDAYVLITYNPNSAPTVALNTPATGGFVGTQTPTLNFTPTDADGDTVTAYTYQVDDDINFGSPIENTEVTGSFTSGVAINRTVVNSLTRGTTYYWRVKASDATNGYGAWSSTFSFTVGYVPTVVAVYPDQGDVAYLYYVAGSNTTPKVRVGWTYGDTDGHAQTQCIVRIYNDNAGSQGTLNTTHTYNGAATSDNVTGFTPTNLSYYWVTFQVTCSGTVQSAESTAKRFRVCWGRASYYYNMGATPPLSWVTPVVNANAPSSDENVIEWSSSTTTTEPTTWYATLAEAPLPNGAANYVWHRVTMMGYDGTGTPAKPTILDITPKWSATALVADNWTVVSQFTIDPADQKFGTQSLKGSCSASTEYLAYQVVPVRANTDYILSGFVKASGNAQASIRVYEADGSAVIVAAPTVAATQEFTRSSSAVFNSGARTSLRIVCRIAGASSTYAWFDALKLEASTIVTPWTPGFIGEGLAIDAGGVQVDAAAGGVFRLRGSTGGARDIVELTGHGLRFGGDVEVSSSVSGALYVGGAITGTDPVQRVYTSTGGTTWNKPANLVYIVVECVGGGGAGGGAVGSGAAGEHSKGGGGGSGGYSRSLILAAALSSSYTATAGAGGTGVSGATGNAGADSSFGSLVIGKGGAGGATSATSTSTFSGALGGAGGVLGTGDIKSVGQVGGWGFGSAALATGGVGAPGPWGGGGQGASAVSQPVSNTGGVAGAYGAGGGGAARTGTGAAATGGAGSDGVVIVTEYYSI